MPLLAEPSVLHTWYDHITATTTPLYNWSSVLPYPTLPPTHGPALTTPPALLGNFLYIDSTLIRTGFNPFDYLKII